MTNPIALIASNIPGLADPTNVSRAAAAIDGIYKRLWADVYEVGTLAALRAGLLARNALYEGNAIAAIYRVLASGHAAAREPHTASHLLAILAALLQDVPAAFAAEGYAHLIYDAMDEGELIIPDYAELNAMRAQPLFVTLALNTLLDRPQRCDTDPHVSVGYVNDLISMDGVDYITSTALQGLLKDRAFRAALYRGLRSSDHHKLFKCLQLLKRCVGGGPGMLGGFRSVHHEISPPWSLQQLLDVGAEEPLVTACNTVARLVRQHNIERQLLGLLHTTLLDIFDLLSAGGAVGGSDHAGPGQEAAASRAVAAAAPAGGNSSSLSTHSSSSESGDGSWPAALVTAHVRLVLEVSRLVPVLVTCLCRMQPYVAQPEAAAALEALGVQQTMAALVAVLKAEDPTDWLMLGLQIEGYQVVTCLVQRSPRLALAALEAGATSTIFTALVAWAAYLPLPANSDSIGPQNSLPSNPDLDVEPFFDASKHGPVEQPALVFATTAAGGMESRMEQQEAQGSLVGSGSSIEEMSRVATHSWFENQGGKVVNPQVTQAAAAALQLLSTFLKAAVAASPEEPTSNATCLQADVPCGVGVSTVAAAGGVAAAAASKNQVEQIVTNTTADSITDILEELPVLLLELWHVPALQALASECLMQLQQLGLLTVAAASGDTVGSGVCMKTLMGGNQHGSSADEQGHDGALAPVSSSICGHQQPPAAPVSVPGVSQVGECVAQLKV